MVVQKDGEGLAALELSIVIILFLIRIKSFSVAFLSSKLALPDLSYGIILILMISAYALVLADYKKKEMMIAESILLAIFVILFLASYVATSLSTASILQTLDALSAGYLYLPVFFVCLLLGSIGTYLILKK